MPWPHSLHLLSSLPLLSRAGALSGLLARARSPIVALLFLSIAWIFSSSSPPAPSCSHLAFPLLHTQVPAFFPKAPGCWLLPLFFPKTPWCWLLPLFFQRLLGVGCFLPFLQRLLGVGCFLPFLQRLLGVGCFLSFFQRVLGRGACFLSFFQRVLGRGGCFLSFFQRLLGRDGFVLLSFLQRLLALRFLLLFFQELLFLSFLFSFLSFFWGLIGPSFLARPGGGTFSFESSYRVVGGPPGLIIFPFFLVPFAWHVTFVAKVPWCQQVPFSQRMVSFKPIPKLG